MTTSDATTIRNRRGPFGGVTTLAACVLAALCARQAQAFDLAVPSPQYPTLRKALRHARPGDRIVLAPGVYDERVALSRREGLTISGPGATLRWTGRRPRRLVVRGERTVLEGLTFERVHLDLRGEGVRLEDVTVTGDSPTSHVVVNAEDVTLTRVTVDASEQTSSPRPWAVYVRRNFATIESCRVVAEPHRGNSTGIRLEAGSAVVRDCDVVDGAFGIVAAGPWTELRGNRVRVVDGIAIQVQPPGLGTSCRENDVAVAGGVGIQIAARAARADANTVVVDAAADGLPARAATAETSRAAALQISGGDVVVYGNHLRTAESRVHDAALDVSGAAAIVAMNTIEWSGEAGIRIGSVGCRLDGNTVTSGREPIATSNGILVTNGPTRLSANVASGFGNGLRLTGPQPATVAGHESYDCDTGIDVLADDVRVSGADVHDCEVHGVHLHGARAQLEDSAATSCLIGVHVVGEDATLASVSALTPRDDGFRVTGDRAHLADCRVTDSGISRLASDGYVVHEARDTVFERCTAEAVGGEGLVDDRGVGTRILACAFPDAGGDGIVAFESVQLDIEDTQVLRAGRAGIWIIDGSETTVVRSVFEGGSHDDVRGSGTYLLLEDNVFTTGSF